MARTARTETSGSASSHHGRAETAKASGVTREAFIAAAKEDGVFVWEDRTDAALIMFDESR